MFSRAYLRLKEALLLQAEASTLHASEPLLQPTDLETRPTGLRAGLIWQSDRAHRAQVLRADRKIEDISTFQADITSARHSL